MVPPLITLEEHYLSSQARSTVDGDDFKDFPKSILDKLENLDDERIKDMDAGGVYLQIISHAPLDTTPNACRHANDELAAACKKSSSRLGAFALLPMGEPNAAADELKRCVKEKGFVGALLGSHFKGTFYDDSKFWPVFARAEELDVPIYFHPTFAADEWMDHYRGNFSERTANMLSTFGWGWHSETGLLVLRLWASGLFDRYPKLKVIIGHMGEMLPFMLDRIYPMSKMWADNKRDLETVWKENFWITTSGMFTLAPLGCLLKTCRIDRILYSVDYPFSDNETGLKFIEELEESGMVSKEDLALICSGNAEKLLKVTVN